MLRICLAVGGLTLAGLAACVSEPARSRSCEPDRELAELLVKLELRTRAVIAGHYGGADQEHRKWLAENLLLPAAVADQVFHETLLETTKGRAWVKMIVDDPRNEHNRGDEVALEMMKEIVGGQATVQRTVAGAVYYAEPIKTVSGCLLCHGEPAGEPDPYFPQFRKNGWQADQVIGAVVARVATEGN